MGVLRRNDEVWLLACAVLFLALPARCTRAVTPPNGGQAVVEQQVSALTAGPCNDGTPCPFSIVTPAALTQASLLLSATSSLKIDDRVTLTESSGTPATIANLSTATLQIGTDGHLGDIWSLGPVTISDRTTVNGTIHGAVSVTTGNGVTIKAKSTAAFQVLTTTSSITFPTQNGGGFDVEPGGTGALTPGSYGAVAVKSTGILHISSGAYLMESLDLEPSSTLALNTTAGPITLYIRTSAILRGNITSTTNARDFTLIYFGSQALFVQAPLNATVVAPAAQVNITSVQPITGAFFASGIEVFSGDTLTHVAAGIPTIVAREGLIQAESFDARSGGNISGTVINMLQGNDWLLYRGVDFGQLGQFNRIQLRLQSPSGIDQVIVHVDSLTGPIIATLQTLATGTGGYIPESATLTSALSGLHDTYIVFQGAENDGLDWFQLSTRAVPTVAANTGQPLVDAGAPNYAAMPQEEDDDIPDDIVWGPIPSNVTIGANSSDGLQFAVDQTFALVGQIGWTGPGPVVVSLADPALNPITIQARSMSATNLFFTAGPIPPETINVLVKNNGSSPVTVNLRIGVFPPPAGL